MCFKSYLIYLGYINVSVASRVFLYCLKCNVSCLFFLFLEGSCRSTLVERQGGFGLDDRNYVHAYNKTLDCWWTILANDSKQIQLHISCLDIGRNVKYSLGFIKVSFVFLSMTAQTKINGIWRQHYTNRKYR